MNLDGYEPRIRPDLHPSFYSCYAEPASHVAALVQQPSHSINADSLSLAYMRDCRDSRVRAARGITS